MAGKICPECGNDDVYTNKLRIRMVKDLGGIRTQTEARDLRCRKCDRVWTICRDYRSTFARALRMRVHQLFRELESMPKVKRKREIENIIGWTLSWETYYNMVYDDKILAGEAWD